MQNVGDDVMLNWEQLVYTVCYFFECALQLEIRQLVYKEKELASDDMGVGGITRYAQIIWYHNLTLRKENIMKFITCSLYDRLIWMKI